MTKIYLKIFLWFWVAMLIVCATLVAVVVNTQFDSDRSDLRQEDSVILPILGRECAAAFERGGVAMLREYEDKVSGPFSKFFLIDENGVDVGGRQYPRKLQDFSRHTLASAEAASGSDAGFWWAAVPAIGPSGRGYTFAMVRQPPTALPPFLRSTPAIQFVRLGAILLAGGMLCLWLASYFGTPVTEIGRVSRELTTGNLRARVSEKLGKRRDEFGNLARDFNTMAARFQDLMLAQQQRLGEISHDLNSPLARLSIALGLARQVTGPNAQDALDRIELETEQLGQMIQQLLGLARVETRMEVPTAPEIDLTSLVKEVAANANFEAIRANRTVQLLACGPSTIRGVKDVVRSAIENVARNAVAHTAEGTSVEISQTPLRVGNTPYALVSVRDHGQCVPPALLSEIFRPFFSVGNSRTSKWGGVGLGLAIAERAVKLNGGSITAANHPDGGLIVEMRFPIMLQVQEFRIENQWAPIQGDHIARDY